MELWLQEATAEKERGNALFKAGRYEEAVERYTRGIKCDPKSAVIVANRNDDKSLGLFSENAVPPGMCIFLCKRLLESRAGGMRRE